MTRKRGAPKRDSSADSAARFQALRAQKEPPIDPLPVPADPAARAALRVACERWLRTFEVELRDVEDRRAALRVRRDELRRGIDGIRARMAAIDAG